MLPYAFDKNVSNSVGCCPGHDDPCCYRWAGRYSSPHSRRTHKKDHVRSKRARRRRDRQRLTVEI